jgi:transposase-like protein
LDLLKAGKPVAQVAAFLGVSPQAIYTWRKQERIDTGERPGVEW